MYVPSNVIYSSTHSSRSMASFIFSSTSSFTFLLHVIFTRLRFLFPTTSKSITLLNTQELHLYLTKQILKLGVFNVKFLYVVRVFSLVSLKTLLDISLKFLVIISASKLLKTVRCKPVFVHTIILKLHCVVLIIVFAYVSLSF